MNLSPPPSLSVPILLAILTAPAICQTENGDWHINGIEAPSRLVETYWDGVNNRQSQNNYDHTQPGEDLVDLFFPHPTTYTSASITLHNGTITGDFPGTYSLGNNGKVSIIADGDPVTGYVNVAADTMIISEVNPDNISVNVATRLPTSLETADLAGTWQLIVLDLPDDLTEVYSDGINPIRTNKASDPIDGYTKNGERLTDTFFEDNPNQQLLTLVIDAAGNITGDAGAGTASVNGDKSVTLNLGGDLNVFYPNAAADVMTLARESLPVYTKIIAVKLPSSPPALADAEGLWRGQWLDFPTYLTEHYHNVFTEQGRDSSGPYDHAQENELLVDTYFQDPPELGTDLLSISASGVVSGSTNGQLSVSGNHFVFTPTGGGDSMNLYPNASGNVITVANSTAIKLNLSTVVKVVETPEPSFNKLVKLQTTFSGGSMGMCWEPATSFVLKQADSLQGPWKVVPGTAGNSCHTIDTSLATKMFYRVEQIED